MPTNPRPKYKRFYGGHRSAYAERGTSMTEPVWWPMHGKCIVSQSNRGGSGKTALLLALAFHLAIKRGWTNLTVDLDPQANATARSGLFIPDVSDDEAATSHRSIIGLLAANPEEAEKVFPYIRTVKYECVGMPLSIIPGCPSLGWFLDTLRMRPGLSLSEIEHRLARVLRLVEPCFDALFIDTPPGADSFITRTALHMADVALIPVDGYDALYGAHNLLEQIRQEQNMRAQTGRGPVQAYLMCPHLTKGRGETTEEDWYDLARRMFPEHFISAVIPHRSGHRFANDPGMAWYGLSKSGLNQDYLKMWDELLRKMADTASGKLPTLTAWMDEEGLTSRALRKMTERGYVSQGKTIHEMGSRSSPSTPPKKRGAKG